MFFFWGAGGLVVFCSATLVPTCQVFVNGYKNHFSGLTMLSEETEPEKDDSRVDSLQLPEGLQVSRLSIIPLASFVAIIPVASWSEERPPSGELSESFGSHRGNFRDKFGSDEGNLTLGVIFGDYRKTSRGIFCWRRGNCLFQQRLVLFTFKVE